LTFVLTDTSPSHHHTLSLHDALPISSVQSFALRLTSPFNLPAPGRRQPLYVVFDFAETCVFVKQSPYAIHCGPLELLTLYRGDPSPEVTGLICRVPERAFSRAPLDILLVYLCRFEVRFPTVLLRGFSWQRGLNSFQPYGLLLYVSPLMSRWICL